MNVTTTATEQSNAEDSLHVVAPNVADDTDGVGSARSRSPHNPAMTSDTLTSTNDDLETPENLPAPEAVSQPMTASSSSSSNPSLKDATTGTASPYGTRSRNRTGISRPNYAEDREMDMEFEMQPTREEEPRKIARSTDPRATSLLDSGEAPNTSQRASALDNNANGYNLQKEHIPGTLTFAANPAAPVPASRNQPDSATWPTTSKKRKATGQPTPNGTSNLLPVINATSVGSQASTRRASIATQSATAFRESNMLSFDDCRGRVKNGKLVADDGTILGVNDHVYLVCEPPGEPYYLGRIMEFLHTNNEADKAIDALRINWYYRPKDIGRKVNDTRQVFASMHSDTSPLTALRGLCQIRHKSEVQNMEEYRKIQNCFWYEKLYDRYIHRYYEVIPTRQIVNVPANVKKVLDERWNFILVESGRGKELTSAVKSCKRCSGYCASNDSVDCAVCHQTYHMNCVRPPLLKKPSRGFAWACGPCSRAQERKLEARNTPNLTDVGLEAEDEEVVDEEEEDVLAQGEDPETGRTSPERLTDGEFTVHPGTAEQIYQASLWPFRYLGVHCKVEDALDYDDRIYPRASSRLGPRHQANVTIWHGRPVELVKPAEVKRKYIKGGAHKKETKLSKEALAALEAEKTARGNRPKWVIDEPPGYIHRGGDYDNNDPNNTAELLFKPPETDEGLSSHSPPEINGSALACSDDMIDDYMVRARELAKHIGVAEYSVNFLDKALSIFYSKNYDADAALRDLHKVDRKALKEPDLTAPELKKFEDGISKFGSELHSVKKHVKTASSADIVRFYYAWKKTDRGKQIWGNYSGRKGKKEARKAEASAVKLQDDVADDQDDSAFDNEKSIEKRRGFQCKFCGTRSSRQWRRAPNTAAGTTIAADPNNKSTGKDKTPQLMVALCLNCAVVWRKYAVQWEESDEHPKKPAQAGGRPGRRKGDEPLTEFQLNEFSWTGDNTDVANTPTSGTPMPQTSGSGSTQEPAKKKTKLAVEKDQVDLASVDSTSITAAGHQKKKLTEKPPGPPLAPEIPKAKMLSCSICLQMEPTGDQHLSCKECRMAVHRNCYGVVGENRGFGKWVCDMCSNDRNPQVSVHYKCTLCPVEFTEQDFVEPPKVSHKKKTEKEREKDRIEREQAQKAADYYRKRQEELGRPVNPREPLKRTVNNNWVHVTCAVWTPEVKFGKARALEPSEGIPSIPAARYEETCKSCKKRDNGACVACHSCRTPVHVECAHQNGYILGFDIAPVKGSRRDQFNIVNINGEVGTMTAAIWCKEHAPTKTIVHRMHDIVDETGLNALQLYVQNFKQADLTLTGTVRKATLINQSTKLANSAVTSIAPNRRTSTATAVSNGARGSTSHNKAEENQRSGSLDLDNGVALGPDARVCVTCGVDVSPKWWPYPRNSVRTTSTYNNDNLPQTGQLLTNGQSMPSNANESPKHHVALAAAALEEKINDCESDTKDQQCHKCHYRGVLRPPASPKELGSQQDVSVARPLSSTQPVSTSNLASPPLMQVPTHYPWSVQRIRSPPGSQADWPRPSPVPAQPVSAVHQFNGNRSPHAASNGQHSIGRHAVVPLSPSPHMNGPTPQQSSISYPSSPHHGIVGTHQPQSGVFVSYPSTRPPPYHLTNGGPPLRAPENPFAQNNHVSHQSFFGGALGSAQVPREAITGSREPIGPNSGTRPGDGRVNGGASASPSLHNLLS